MAHVISETRYNKQNYHLILPTYHSHVDKDKSFWIKVEENLSGPKFEILALHKVTFGQKWKLLPRSSF